MRTKWGDYLIPLLPTSTPQPPFISIKGMDLPPPSGVKFTNFL